MSIGSDIDSVLIDILDRLKGLDGDLEELSNRVRLVDEANTETCDEIRDRMEKLEAQFRKLVVDDSPHAERAFLDVLKDDPRVEIDVNASLVTDGKLENFNPRMIMRCWTCDNGDVPVISGVHHMSSVVMNQLRCKKCNCILATFINGEWWKVKGKV